MQQTLRPSPFHTIVLGGLAIGLLDAVAAMANAGINGVMPNRVWQYVASSVLGSDSFSGGAITVGLGLLFHFCVAFGVATGFYFLVRSFPALLVYTISSGLLYGVGVYFAMSCGIVPLTAARQPGFSWYGLISGLIIHALFVGLPVAFVTRRYARRS